MKLSVVFPVLNQFELATEAITMAIQQLSGENDVEVIIFDNGSDKPYEIPEAYKELMYGPLGGEHALSIVHSEKNIGVYPVFWKAFLETSGDVVCYFHSDMVVVGKNWDTDVLQAFTAHEDLGLLGFIGSDEIDQAGGRGGGTTSNFMGGQLEQYGVENPKTWKGSPAEAHGKRNGGYTNAAVVDGCAMIFSREVLMQIPQRSDFPPHHFYDRLLSCEVRELGYKVGVLGIECDHISGQTVSHEEAYHTMAREWLLTCGKIDPIRPIDNPDHQVYQIAEKMWLDEYREQKHLIPVKV